MIYRDENNTCTIELPETAISNLHDKFAQAGLTDYLSDVDWIVETSDSVMLIEYKNTDIENVRNPEAFYEKIKNDKLIEKLRKKYYGGVFYSLACKTEKPIDYICIIEATKLDRVWRKKLTAKIKRGLPYKLQELPEIEATLIHKCQVLSIAEWNEQYSEFPLKAL